MVGSRIRWIVLGVVAVALLAVSLVLAFGPKDIPVDFAEIDRGPLAVTVDEEGLARIADVYSVSAPIAGALERPPVEVGDVVHRNTSAVATIRPVDPPFLDVRSRREIEAAIASAHAAVGLAEAQLDAANASTALVQADYDRAERLADRGTISDRELELARTNLATARAQVQQAKANLDLKNAELLRAQASLIEPDQPDVNPGRDACCMTVRSPVDGVVLSVAEKSEQVVQAGAKLVEIGDPADMEVIVHLLSSDAVKVETGALATLTDWGGEGVLDARVARIDPAAYTKVSALGIEEQRVDAVLELVSPRDAWLGLGHEFRVMVHITLWQDDKTLRVPLGALFRQGSDWHVYRDVEGKAVLTKVTIGERNNSFAQVIDGLSEGDQVVLHPSDRIVDGVGIVSRAATEG